MQQAYLIGLAHYPDHTLAGVPNDLVLIEQGLQQQGFAAAEIHTFGAADGTRAGLQRILTQIRTDFAAVEPASARSHCFFYFGGSGMLALEPLQGGFQPVDGDAANFQSALAFTELNRQLPVRPGIQVTVVLDC